MSAFDDIEPYSGSPPAGYLADWLGILTDAKFRTMFGVDAEKVGGHGVTTRRPVIEDGEGWFENLSAVAAARAASGQYVMMTLGACYGAQAVGAYTALRKLNPMPATLVAVDPEPDNIQWVAKHFRDNGIAPEDHWLLASAISDSNDPVLFPVGSPGTGAQNCYSTNEPNARKYYLQELLKNPGAEEALRRILTNNTTGMQKDLVEGMGFNAEIKFVSSVTIKDLLGPFRRVDYIEVDMQQSEIIAIPPAIDVLTAKAKRMHIGTHGKDVHSALATLFRDAGWTTIFDYEPNELFETPFGRFSTNDGVLAVVNPRV